MTNDDNVADQRCVFHTRGVRPVYVRAEHGSYILVSLRRNGTVFATSAEAESHRAAIAKTLYINPADLILVSPEAKQ